MKKIQKEMIIRELASFRDSPSLPSLCHSVRSDENGRAKNASTASAAEHESPSPCHPERNMAIGEADGHVDSKDPYSATHNQHRRKAFSPVP
jgi:hypothetical protein